MAGRLFRIGHLGDLNELMLLGGIAGAEMAMRDAGIKITPGSGVGAAAGVLARHRQAARQARPAAPRAGRAAGRGAGQGEGHRGRQPMSHTRYEPARQRLQRSELAVPGSQPAHVPEGAGQRGGLRLPRSRGRGRAGRQGAGPAQRDPGRCWSTTGAAAGKTICGPDQRDRHPLHVSRRGGCRGAGGPPARHDADSQGRRAGRRLPGRRAPHPDRRGERHRRTASASTC